MVSSDDNLNWISLFSNLSTSFHQLVGVPVYEDGAHCGFWDSPAVPVSNKNENQSDIVSNDAQAVELFISQQ